MGMRLGLNLGYWSPGDNFADQCALVEHAESLGFDICWVAEAYGSDAATILGGLAARTRRIGLGSAVFQLPARSPAMTAMTAATLDRMSDGRFRLGLGVSGPQVSEGWHGVRFDAPLARTREYVDVVRLALARRPVAYAGRHLQLPLPDGPGKALRMTVAPVQESLPVYLAAVGPRNLELAGEIADGWLGIFFSPETSGDVLDRLTAGRRKAGRTLEGFDVCTSVPVAVDDDPERAADLVRGYFALYIGGMGSRERNFYHATATRLGFGAAADEIQDHFLAGRHREAAEAVPFELIDRTALLGPADRIASRLARYAEAGVTTLAASPFSRSREELPHVLTALAEAAARRPGRTGATPADTTSTAIEHASSGSTSATPAGTAATTSTPTRSASTATDVSATAADPATTEDPELT